MRVGIVQLDIVWEDRDANFRKVEDYLAEAERKKVDLVVLPEMFAIGFTMNAAPFAEGSDGPTTRFLSQSARRWGVHILGACVFQSDTLPRNAALLYGPTGELLARYDKIHPFTMSKEHENYAAGDRLVVVPALGFNILLSVCYDLRFPELYRAALDLGADLITVIANWPIEREHHWRFLSQSRAVDNLSYVVACNRTGEGGGLTYPGASLAVDPTGEVLVDGGREEGLYTADLTPRTVERARRAFPFLRDRKPELYRQWQLGEGPG